MAKRKDDDLDDLDLSALDEEPDADDAPAPDVELEEVAGGDGDDGPPPKKQKVRPQVPLATTLLGVLNVLAAVAFFFLLLLDYGKRQQWSYAVFRHDLALMGLPLEEDRTYYTAAQHLQPPVRLPSDLVRQKFNARGGSGGDKFREVEEVLRQRITPDMLSDATLTDVFQSVGGEPVRTLEEEVRRVQQRLPSDVAQAADEVVQNTKGDPARQKLAARLLLPLAYTSEQVQDLDRRISSATGATLQDLLKDAVQRRLLVDLLRLLNLHRPVEEVEDTLKLAADPKQVDLGKLQEQLNQRVEELVAGRSSDGSREFESYTKRENIALFLAAVGQLAKAPGGQQKLYEQGAERAQTVAGLVDYNRALDTLASLNDRVYDRYLQRIAADREGEVFQGAGGQTAKTDGFVARYEALVKRVVDAVAELRNLEFTRARLEDQKKRNADLRDNRTQDQDAVAQRLAEARAETARLVGELRQLETQMFAAQQELADVAERNVELENEIRKLEQSSKGRPTP